MSEFSPYLGAANITSKQKSGMAKVAIKNREYHFFRWNLHHFFVAFHTSPLVWVGDFMIMQEPRTPENPHING